MYSPTPKKRPKPKLKLSSPQSSSLSSLSSSSPSIMDPPRSLFPSKEEFLRLVAVLAIAITVALACDLLASYFNRQTKPFCDTNIDSPDSVSDFCEPCPRNGECHQGKLKCACGYRKHGNMCIEDSDINERANKLSKWVESHLCEVYAQFLCDGTGTVWVQEDDMWNDLDGHQPMEHFDSDNVTHLYVKKKTMETIHSLLVIRINPHGKKELRCPDALGERYKPFTCRIRQWISNHALVIAPVCAMVLGSTFLLWKVQRRWYLLTRSEELYSQVCDILEENALTSSRVHGESEPWVVAAQLRDHLLLPKERKNSVLWKKVEELVQEDSRIDQYPKLVKGESKVVWEWQVEGSLSSARMRKKQASKLKAIAGIETKFEQRHALNSGDIEPKIPMF